MISLFLVLSPVGLRLECFYFDLKEKMIIMFSKSELP